MGVEKHGFDVNYQTHESGMTPLMELARYGNVGALPDLLALGADTSLQNVNGHTAKDIAQMVLPEYLTLHECQCSSNRWDIIKAKIDADRCKVAQELEKAEKKTDERKACTL